ncbi:MAG: hypothetical protein IT229_12280 [Flavobacteriales bacterium]|nr:hypothetical protein [Flavobacteriales bacterium]
MRTTVQAATAGRWVVLLLFGLVGSAVHPQNGWTREQFTVESGLPQNSVRSLAIDSIGHLWVTTEGGLVRYDGRRMRVFNSRNDTDLLDDRMGNLLTGPDGGLLVNDVRGDLYRIATSDVERVVGDRHRWAYPQLISGRFPSLDLYRWLLEVAPNTEHPAWSRWDMRFLPLSARTWAVCSRDTLYVYSGMGPPRTIPARPLLFGGFEVKQEVFFLGKDRVFRRLDAKSGSLVELAVFGLDPRLVEHMIWNSGEGGVFAVGDTAIWRVVSTSPRSIHFEEVHVDLPEHTRLNAVLSIDDGHTLFVGTSTQGLFRYTRHRFMSLLPRSVDVGAGDNAFYAQAVLDSGRVLTPKGLVCGPNGFENGPFMPGSFDVQCVHRDTQGRIWRWGSNTLWLHQAASGELIRKVPSLVGRVTVFLEEPDTLWWVGANGLVAWVDDSAHLVLEHRSTNYREDPFALVRGPDGHLWWGTGHGVWRVVGQRLVAVPGLETTYARTLYSWRGRMLVGTYGEGPLVVEGGKVTRLPLDVDGALSHVHAFIPDAWDRIWMPTNRGLFVVRMDALENLLAHSEGILTYRSFGRSEGLRTLEFNGGCSPPYVRLPNGDVSLATMDGLVRFVPEAIEDASKSFWPAVDGVRLNGEVRELSMQAPLSLHRSDRVTLQFTLPFWDDPADLQVHYRVQGLDEHWQLVDPAIDKLTIERLPPGSYTVQLMRAGDGDSVRDLMDLVVLSSWYERPPVIAMGVFLLAAIVWALFRFRTGQLLKAQERLEILVNERTQALQHSNSELTKALSVKDRLISILSHDIVSPLRFISRVATRTLGSARSEKPEVLRHTLAEISSSSEKLYANASNILEWIRNHGGSITVVPTVVAVKSLTEEVMSQFQQHSSTVRFVNMVPEDDQLVVDPRLLGIVLQNLLANAAGHAGKLVRVEGERTQNRYRITVKDNGPGMSSAARERIQGLRTGNVDVRSATDRPGLGYMIIHDVLDLLDGDYAIETPEEGGTWVHVYLPEREM